MKKLLIYISLVFALSNNLFAKDSEVTDKSLYNQIVYYFNNGIYDSSISLINQIKQEFPSSTLLEECDFIYGKCLYYQKKYNKALTCFYDICQNKESPFFYDSVLFSARSYFLMQKFNEAIPLYEFIISNGNVYQKNDYVESLKKLVICYNNTGNKSKTEKLLAKINKEELGLETFEQLENINNSVLADYYQAKKMVDDSNVAEGLKVLNQIKTEVEVSEDVSLKDAYYALLIRCYALTQNWALIPECYNKINQKNNNIIYFTAHAHFYLKNYDKVIELLENKSYLQELYKFSLAIQSFKAGDYSKSLKVSQSLKDPLSNYLCGLNHINLKNWKKAISSFDLYLKSNPKNKYLSLFYKGYAEFLLTQNKQSLASFNQFINDFSENNYDNKYLKFAYEYSIRNAMNLDQKETVFKYADLLMLNAKSEVEKYNTAIFVAEIYSDYSEYQKAIDILIPFTKNASEDKVSVIYALANLYERNEDFDNAHNLYNSIYKKYPKNAYGPLALYRQAQVYFATKDYKNAENCFYKFIYDYPNDENLVAAMYYCSECYLQNDKKQNALMMCNSIITNYQNSTYEYAAYNTMLSLYYHFENYGEALNIANILIKKYPSQVYDDGVVEKQKELSKIVAGADKEIAKKYGEYSKLGKNSIKGRIVGTELVTLYANNNQSEESFLLATQLIPLQSDEKETFYKAQNLENVAAYYKNKTEYKKAAEFYLQATEAYRITDKIKPAETLYICVECFSLAKMRGDAEETAKLLIELYPETKYAKNVKMLIKN